jgi:hypothetical protein
MSAFVANFIILTLILLLLYGLVHAGTWLLRTIGEVGLFLKLRRVLTAEGSWIEISNTSCEPLFYGQSLGRRSGQSNVTIALRGLLLPEALSTDLVAALNQKFPNQKDTEGHFLVLAVTGDYVIATKLTDQSRVAELSERFASMNEESAPRVQIGSNEILVIDEAERNEFDEIWRARSAGLRGSVFGLR